MKKFLALVLALVMTMSLVTVSASAKTDFTDDAKITNEEAVEVLNAMGVLTGYADGSFRPQATLTRGAGAKIIAYLVLGQKAADKLQATYTVYKDVTDSVGLAAYIEWAAANGIVDGYGDGNFGPYNTLTEYAFGKMLLTALGYSSEKEGYTGAGWQKAVYTNAVALGIFDGTETYGACDRETAARMALGALEAHIVAYGTKTTAGSYVWNGQTVTGNIWGTVTVTGAVELNKTLGDLYGVSKAAAMDIYDRPGHTWSYGTWSKFYMDAPVAEYYDKVDACQILIDCGVAKTSKATITVDYVSENGVSNGGVDFILAHNNCAGIYGGKGVLTQVFKKDGKYIITEIDTYLAKVTGVKAATHGVIGDEVKLDVYYKTAKANENTDYCGTKTVWVVGATGLTKGDYILVNGVTTASIWSGDPTYIGSDDLQVYYTAANAKDGYINILGAASSFEGKLTAKTAAASLVLTVADKAYGAANEYALSYARNALGTTAKWFLDQYGNIIGDVALASEALKYGRIDALKWVSDGRVNESEVISANLVTAAGDVVTEADIDLGTYKTLNNSEAATLTAADLSASVTVGTNVSEIKSMNNGYYAKDANYGVVAYDSKYNVAQVGELIKHTGKNDLSLTNKQVYMGIGDKSNKNVYADDETQYLVYLGKDATTGAEIYKAYQGINALPTITNIEDIVVIASANSGVQAYAEFVFVYAPAAIYAGATVEAYVFADAYQQTNLDGTVDYKVWVNGAITDIVADKALSFDGEGVYHITFNADSQANGVTKCAAALTTASGLWNYDKAHHYVNAKGVQVDGTNALNKFNVTNAKVYTTVNGIVEEYKVTDIEAGDLFLVKFTDDSTGDLLIVDTIYVTSLADGTWFN